MLSKILYSGLRMSPQLYQFSKSAERLPRLNTPILISVGIENNTINVLWESVINAELYEIIANGIIVGTTTNLMFEFDVLAYMDYEIRVRAKATGFRSSNWSNFLIVSYVPPFNYIQISEDGGMLMADNNSALVWN